MNQIRSIASRLAYVYVCALFAMSALEQELEKSAELVRQNALLLVLYAASVEMSACLCNYYE